MDFSEIPPSIMRQLSEEQQYTLRLLLKTKDQELRELKFKAEIKEMKERLSAANYRVLLSQKLLTTRSFMRFIRDEFLFEVEGTFKETLMVLADENLALFEEWKLNKDEYFSTYQKLMKALNEHAHPFFKTNEAFILVEGDLNLEALQLIGFLWCVIPLPQNNLLIRKVNNDVIPLITFIKE